MTILIGAIVGGMICTDLGGPINKTALVFGTAVWLASVEISDNPNDWNFVPGTATQAAISIPPLAAFFSVTLFKNRFTLPEKTLGVNAGVMSAFGITEGAIPFAAAKPKVFIPANIIGGMLAGSLVTAFGFQFYGGLGSPLGAIFGYIPRGMDSTYVVSIILWFIVIIFSALVTTFIIWLGLIATSKKGLKTTYIYDLKENYKNNMSKIKKSKLSKEEKNLKLLNIKKEYKKSIIEAKNKATEIYHDYTNQKVYNLSQLKEEYKLILNNQKLKLQKLKNKEEFKMEQKELKIKLKELSIEYKKIRKEILNSDLKISVKWNKTKEELKILGSKEDKLKKQNEYQKAKMDLKNFNNELKIKIHKIKSDYMVSISSETTNGNIFGEETNVL